MVAGICYHPPAKQNPLIWREQFYLVQFGERHNILFLMQHKCWQIELPSLIKMYIYIYIYMYVVMKSNFYFFVFVY